MKSFSPEKMRKMYAVVKCYKCGKYLLAKMDQKTRKCPNCNSQLQLIKTKKIAYSETAKEASDLIRKLKEKDSPSSSQLFISGKDYHK